uniref:General transcription factor IIE subunit 1 n=1 Tax=Megaselia scalaris TaxID=36166 RepID=T1GWN2_MEGSC
MSSQPPPKPETRYVTEVPSSLKQLARLVVRGFYSIEDALIIDMLVRNPLKYKLDLMRKRMETEERDATSRASFRCVQCNKTFTDLEADQLFDFATQEFHCTYCGSNVEEDMSALPKKDSRLLLAKFNEQLQPLYDLLREVEGIQLAPEILEPEPVDLDTIRGITKPNSMRPEGQMWSGEATRNQGFAVEETTVDINIGDNDTVDHNRLIKDRPIWMTETLEEAASTATTTNARKTKESEDIMAILLLHEKKSSKNDPTQSIRRNNAHSDDSSDDENGKKEENGK